MAKVTVELGGRKLPVPPASLGSIKRWLTAEKEKKAGTVEYIEALTDFVYSTLTRPGGTSGLDRAWLEDQLDGTNIVIVINKIYEAGGLSSGETQGEAS